MKKKNLTFIKTFPAILAACIFLICIIPIRQPCAARLILRPLEKKLRNKIEFKSSLVKVSRGISLWGVSAIDAAGRGYYCASADVRYGLPEFILKREFSFALKDIKFYGNIGLMDSVTEILSIDRLPDVEFNEVSGTVRLLEEGVSIKNASASGDSVRIEGGGRVGKDGMLDCDIHFSFSPDITDKVPEVIKAALLEPEDGNRMGISFKAYGNYKNPSLHLRSDGLKLNIMRGIFDDE